MSKKSKQINGLPYTERLEYFCGGKVTVGKIAQVKDGKVVSAYRPKIRGVFIGGLDEMYQFKTEQGARDYGRVVLSGWKLDLEGLK